MSKKVTTFEGKDPKDMSEEEKLQWKNQVFQDCKDMDDRIDNNLKLI